MGNLADAPIDEASKPLSQQMVPINAAPPEQWAMVEIFGHRSHCGRLVEVERFGTKLMRIDVPTADPNVFTQHFYGGAAIFSISPMTEKAARETCERHRRAYGSVESVTELDEDPDTRF